MTMEWMNEIQDDGPFLHDRDLMKMKEDFI
jgi:hypothetical protein